ncbi:MAG: histidine kinase [Bacteroidota bacterium]
MRIIHSLRPRYLPLRYIAAIYLGLCISFCWGQTFSPGYFKLDQTNLLPTNHVYATFQDTRGYVWIGTDRGLFQFDGEKIKNFPDAPRNPIDIFRITQDDKGRIWFNGPKGIFYEYEGQFHELPYKSYLDSIVYQKSTWLISWHLDAEDHFWFTFSSNPFLNNEDRGPNHYYWEIFEGGYRKHLFKDIPHYLFLPMWKVSTQSTNSVSYVAKVGGEWLYTGYQSVNRVKGPEVCEKNIPYSRRVETDRAIARFEVIDEQEFIFSEGQGLLRVRDSVILQRRFHKSPANGQIIGLFKGKKGREWVCTLRGAYVSPIDCEEVVDVFLPDIAVNCVMEDFEGNIWFSTGSDGIFILPNENFRRLTLGSDPKSKPLGELVVFQDHLWFHNQKVQFMAMDTLEKIHQVANHGAYPSLHWNIIEIPDVDTFIYSSSWKIFYGLDEAEDIRGNTKDNGFWGADYVVGDDGLIYSGNSNEFMRFRHKPFEPQYLSRELNTFFRTNDIEKGPHGEMWIGTSQGIKIYKNDTLVDLQDLMPQADKHTDVPIFSVEYLGEEEWIYSAFGEGLYTIRDSQQVPLDFGLPYESFRGELYVENRNQFWTILGPNLYRITRSQPHEPWRVSLKIGQVEGLCDYKIYDIVKWREKYWVTSDKGLVFFQDIDSLAYRYQVKTHIESLEVHGDFYAPQNDLSFEPAINDVKIRFKGISIRDRGNVKYRYRLLGYNDEWEDSEESSISFLNLPPGAYTFQVVASSPTFPTEGEAAEVSFYMAPYIYETLLFLVFAIIFGVAALLFIIFTAIRIVNRRSILQRELIEARYEALQGQMSPHFIFNAMNSILYLINTDNRKAAAKYLTTFARLLRRILADAKFTFVPLVDEIFRAQEYLSLEKLQFDERLIYRIEVDDDLKVHQLLVPQMLIQPFLENAVRHGIRPRGIGRIDLLVESLGENLRISIMDDGIGMERSKTMRNSKPQGATTKGTGIGIRNTRERLASISRLYGISTELNFYDLEEAEGKTGTKVELILPQFDQQPGKAVSEINKY